MKLAMTEQRSIAQGALRSQLRKNHLTPENVNSDDALVVLDDLARLEPKLIVSCWYTSASQTQIVLFCREWRA